MEKYELLKKKLTKYGQEHLLAFWDELNKEEKNSLTKQIEQLDLDYIQKLYSLVNTNVEKNNNDLIPLTAVSQLDFTEEEIEKYTKCGIDVIKKGGYAVCIMAGGQGTRLGFNGPKGCFVLDDKNNKSLFNIFVDKLISAYNKYGKYIHLFIMTSRENNNATVEYFKANNYFEYPKEYIHFFEQEEQPMLLENGKLILETKSKIKQAADGHGGIIRAMKNNNIIQFIKKEKIKWIFMGGVDNCLLRLVDEMFIGITELSGVSSSTKTLQKAYPKENLGVFCLKNNMVEIIEYTELSDELANMRKQDGQLLYSDAHVMMNMFSTDSLELLAREKMPYHVAHKKSNYIDVNGNEVVPTSVNAYKFEAFIFDAFKMISQPLLYRAIREDEFAPLKNKEGIDSIVTARELYYDYLNRKSKGE